MATKRLPLHTSSKITFGLDVKIRGFAKTGFHLDLEPVLVSDACTASVDLIHRQISSSNIRINAQFTKTRSSVRLESASRFATLFYKLSHDTRIFSSCTETRWI